MRFLKTLAGATLGISLMAAGAYAQELKFANYMAPTHPYVAGAFDPFAAMVQTASSLKASKLVVGVSARMASEELARKIGLAWERLPQPRHAFSLEINSPDREAIFVNKKTQ